MGVGRNIRLTVHPTRPSLSGAIRITDCLNKPAAAKWKGTSARRRVLTPESEHGLVSIMWPNGLFYAHTVGTFGVASAGQNWDRLASAARRCALKLVGNQKAFLLLFSDEALFLAEDGIFAEDFLIIVFF